MYSKFLIPVIASTLLFASCQEDSVVDEILPTEEVEESSDNDESQNSDDVSDSENSDPVTDENASDNDDVNDDVQNENDDVIDENGDVDDTNDSDNNSNDISDEIPAQVGPVVNPNNIGKEIVLGDANNPTIVKAADIGLVTALTIFTPQDGNPDFLPSFSYTADANSTNFISQWYTIFAGTQEILVITDTADEIQSTDFDTLVPATGRRGLLRTFNIIYEAGSLENFNVGESFDNVRATEPNKAAVSVRQVRVRI